MANKPKNLEPTQFKKGEDSRRHIKQKGERWWKTRFDEFLLNWCERKKVSPQKLDDDIWETWKKKIKKGDWRALEHWLNRRFGKVPEKIKADVTVKKMEEIEEAIQKVLLKKGGQKIKSEGD